MRPNRKADLQRKLTLAAVPTPPAGLAERIKTDIPKHFPDSTLERKRLGSAVAFNMRVAASILLLIGSLFVALHLLNREYQQEEKKMGEFAHALERNEAPNRAVSPVPKLQQSASNVVTSTEEAPAKVAPPQLKTKKADAQFAEADARRAENQFAYANPTTELEKKEEAGRASKDFVAFDKQRDDLGRAPAAPIPSPAQPVPPPPAPAAVPESITAQSEAPSFDKLSGGARSVPAPAAGAAPQKAGNDLAARKSAPAGLVGSAQASDLAFARSSGVFGYSMERRQLDGAASLDGVAPLVQYFAAPEARPQQGVRLEADAAPSPLDPSKGVLRISIDAAANPGGTGASNAPVAADARLEIEINPKAVVSHHAVTGEPSTSAQALLEGMSMTAVYDFRLVPSISGRTRLATVRLHYRSMPDGHERTLEREIRVKDIAESWVAAPQRTRRASLAATFGETRERGGDTSTIAEKARAIGLDELAELAKPR